jgi:hypothetical protein
MSGRFAVLSVLVGTLVAFSVLAGACRGHSDSSPYAQFVTKNEHAAARVSYIQKGGSSPTATELDYPLVIYADGRGRGRQEASTNNALYTEGSEKPTPSAATAEACS